MPIDKKDIFEMPIYTFDFYLYNHLIRDAAS